MNFSNPYNRKDFAAFLENFLPDDFQPLEQKIDYQGTSTFTQKVVRLGECDSLELEIFEVTHTSTHDARIGLSQEAFKLMQKYSYKNRALIAFVPADNSGQWRFSLLHIELEQHDKKARVSKNYSNPRRYSFLLGEGEKVKTPQQFLIDEGKVKAQKRNKRDYTVWEDLCYRFSVEVLSERFFAEYKLHYQHFCGHLFENYKKLFNPKDDYKEIRDFCKKLLGRIVFLYFLQKKGWLGATSKEYTDGDKNFMSNYFNATDANDAFYFKWLSPLFFETLNKERPNHDFCMPNGSIVKIPFLNGGLFENDFSTNKIIDFPQELFKNLFEFFDQYNFTIYEDDPHDHTVAVDPEMLGHIFENLLEDNKDKGAYYTPKEIVHYMCQESLIEYLTTKQIDRTIVEKLLKKQLGDNDNNLTKQCISEINVALDEVKICDPAIGSGAFPMGLLQEIFSAKQMLHLFEYGSLKNFDASKIKLNIIQNSIYGVDIEKGAVDIAQLRFWLSLIIDKDKPEPLPNLDYKIVVGNSLVSKFEDDVVTIDWERKTSTKSTQQHIKDLQKNLKTLTQKQAQFFKTDNHSKKEKLKNEIRLLKIDILINQISFNKLLYTDKNKKADTLFGLNAKEQKRNLEIDYAIADFNKSLQKLQSLKTKPDQPLHFFDWKLDFPEVMNPILAQETAGLNETQTGFDIVIGNPPYVSIEGLSVEDRELYKSIFDFFYHRYDLFGCFIEQGIGLLKNNGILCFIQPSVFLNSKSFMKIREYIVNNCSLKSLNLLKDGIFDSAVVPTMIMCLSKNVSKNNIIKCSQGQLQDFYTLKQMVYETTEANVFNLDLNDEVAGFINKTSDNTVLLGDIARISRAMNVGDYAKFLVNGNEFENNKNYIKVLKGGSIRKWYFEYKDFYLKKCFDKFVSRGDLEVLTKPKLMMKRIGKIPDVCYDDTGIAGLDTIYTIRILNEKFSPKYILGLLNSKLIGYVFRLRVPLKGDVFPEFRIFDLNKQIPIKNITLKQQQPIIDLTDQILSAKQSNPTADTSDLEQKIDGLVYKLYGLTDEEIAIIEQK